MLKEEFAAQAHDQWSHWMKYLFSKSIENQDGSVTIPKDLVDRWKRQMETSFFMLSEQEQKSDYEQADKFIKLLNYGTYEAKLWRDNGRISYIEANTLDVLKSKCTVAMDNDLVTSIEVQKVTCIGYLKSPLLSEEDLLK